MTQLSLKQQLANIQAIQAERAQYYNKFQEGFKAFSETRQEGPYSRLIVDLTSAFNECSRRAIAIEAALKTEYNRPDLAGLIRCIQINERDKLRLTSTMQALRQAYAFNTFTWQQQNPDVDPLEIHAHDPDLDVAVSARDQSANSTLPATNPTNSAQALAPASSTKYGDNSLKSGTPMAISQQQQQQQQEGPHDAPCDGDDSSLKQGSDVQQVPAGHAPDGSDQHFTGQAHHGHHQHGHHCCGCGHGARPAPEPTEAEWRAAVGEATQLLNDAINNINEALDEIREAMYDMEDE